MGIFLILNPIVPPRVALLEMIGAFGKTRDELAFEGKFIVVFFGGAFVNLFQSAA